METLKNILKNGGATLNAKGEAVAYKKGYQVSVCDICTMPVRYLHKYTVDFYRKKLASDEYLGIWIDNGVAYIDKSKNISTKKEAVAFGKRNNQISIWNWKAGCAVYLKTA